MPTWDMASRRNYLTMLGVDKMEDFLGGPHDLEASAKKVIKTSARTSATAARTATSTPATSPPGRLCTTWRTEIPRNTGSSLYEKTGIKH